jgi:hypothetical protein
MLIEFRQPRGETVLIAPSSIRSVEYSGLYMGQTTSLIHCEHKTYEVCGSLSQVKAKLAELEARDE